MMNASDKARIIAVPPALLWFHDTDYSWQLFQYLSYKDTFLRLQESATLICVPGAELGSVELERPKRQAEPTAPAGAL